MGGQLSLVGGERSAYPPQKAAVIGARFHQIDQAQRRLVAVEQHRAAGRPRLQGGDELSQLRGGPRSRGAGGQRRRQQPPAVAAEGEQVERRQAVRHLRQGAQLLIQFLHQRQPGQRQQLTAGTAAAQPDHERLGNCARYGVPVNQAASLGVGRQQPGDVRLDPQAQELSCGERTDQRQTHHHHRAMARRPPAQPQEQRFADPARRRRGRYHALPHTPLHAPLHAPLRAPPAAVVC